jgi:hypothetical protein
MARWLAPGCAVLALLCVLGPGAAWARQGEVIFSAGYLTHNINLSSASGYGDFLNRRFKVDALVLTGRRIGVAYMASERASVGVELDSLTGGFDYENLNGTDESATFTLNQTIFTFRYLATDNISLAAGLGVNSLERQMEGYKDESILTTNLSDNGGSAKDTSDGNLVLLEAAYGARGKRLGWQAGLRYTGSVHTISSSDDRPGLDELGRPVDMDFVLSGFGIHLTVNLYL